MTRNSLPHRAPCRSPAVEQTQVGPFLILKRLGNNRRQRVFHARQVEQQKDVALKFINVPPNVAWHKALDKLDREFNQLSKLRHPNLVRVFGAGVEEEKVFLATELIDGESLSTLLSRRGKLAHDQVVEYGKQIADVLVFLHDKDLIHSKLTPEKILITADHKVKIADLRLNRAKRRRWDSTRRRELDIAAYMAPEQFTEGATEKSDFYSLGVIVYEMLSGKLPYPPDTMGRMTKNKMNAPVPSIAKQVMNCPMWLDKIVTQMLDPDPRRRPHSAQAIAMAFEEIKNIDATQKAAVDQMASGFNALTAGEDKSEAQRLLGQETKPKKTGPPFYQSVWFQTVALVLVALGIVYLVQFTTQQSKLEQARQLVESKNEEDWSEARNLLGPIMWGDGELAKEATEVYYLSRQKSLVARAEAGEVSRLDNEDFQQFIKAYRLQSLGQDEEAAKIYSRLVVQIPFDSDQRHIHRESKLRYQTLSNKFQWPTNTNALMSLIAECEAATTEAKLIEAQSKLGNLTIRFAGEDGYADVIDAAGTSLVAIKERLVSLRNPTSSEETEVDAKTKVNANTPPPASPLNSDSGI